MNMATQPRLELIQVADVVAREKGIEREEVLEAMEQTFLTSDPNWKLGRRLMTALQAGELAGGDHRAISSTSAALQVSGEAAFPLLDLRIDFRTGAVEELMELYERSQDLWAQQWRDELLELPMLNRLVA